MTNIHSLDAHRERIQHKALIASQLEKTVDESNRKLIALIDGKVFNFRKPIESVEDFVELISLLENQGIQDTQVALKNGKLITHPEQAIGENTFMFSDEASIFLFDLLGKMYNYGVTDTGNPLIISK